MGELVIFIAFAGIGYFVQTYFWKKKAEQSKDTIIDQNGIEIHFPNGRTKRYEASNFIEFRYSLDLNGRQPSGVIKLIDKEDGVAQIFQLKPSGVESKYEKSKDLQYDSEKIINGLQAHFERNKVFA